MPAATTRAAPTTCASCGADSDGLFGERVAVGVLAGTVGTCPGRDKRRRFTVPSTGRLASIGLPAPAAKEGYVGVRMGMRVAAIGGGR